MSQQDSVQQSSNSNWKKGEEISTYTQRSSSSSKYTNQVARLTTLLEPSSARKNQTNAMNNYYSVLVQVCISESPPKTLLSITRIQDTLVWFVVGLSEDCGLKRQLKSKYAQMHGSSTQYEATVRMQVKLSLDYKRTNPSHSHLGSAGCVS